MTARFAAGDVGGTPTLRHDGETVAMFSAPVLPREEARQLAASVARKLNGFERLADALRAIEFDAHTIGAARQLAREALEGKPCAG